MAPSQPSSCCSACAPGASPAPPRTLFPTFVFTALTLAVTLGVSTGGWAIWRMAFATGTVLASHLQLHAHVQLLGFAGLLILGVALHALPRILGVASPSRRVVFTVLLGVGGGALLRAIGQPLAPRATGRLLSPFVKAPGALSLRAPFAFLGLFAMISVAACLGELSGAAVHKFVWDGARHVYTIGFLTLLIFGMSLRIVPAFTGRTLARPREARLALALVSAAAVVRALQIPVALGFGGLPLYRLVGTTGVFATAGFLLWAHVLVATLCPRAVRAAITPPMRLPVRMA